MIYDAYDKCSSETLSSLSAPLSNICSRRQLIFYFEYLNHQNTIKFWSPKRKCFILNISTTKIYSNLLTLKCIFFIIPQPPNTVY